MRGQKTANDVSDLCTAAIHTYATNGRDREPECDILCAGGPTATKPRGRARATQESPADSTARTHLRARMLHTNIMRIVRVRCRRR